MVNIFIANLDWEITTEDIMSTFSSFGTVSYANVVYDKDTKKSKGFAYVEMESSDEAINAIEALNGLEINGRAIDVKIASPKGNRPQKKEQKKFAPKGQGFGQKRTGDNRPRQGGGGGFSGNRNNFNRNNNNSNRSGSGSGSGSGWSGEKRDFSKTIRRMTEAVDQGYVEASIQESGIAIVEFGHPMSNSLPGKILRKLADTITEMGQNDAVKVIVLRSGGERAFCAGASFDELISIKDFPTGKEFFSGFAKVINACRKCPKLIIGRVHGKAVGGGVGVASAVDYCFATKDADVKLSELAVGIGPFVVGPAVQRKMGMSAMSQLAINATEWRSAQWAYENGLYAGVYDSAEEMDVEIDALATRLAKSNPEAMGLLKKIFWEGTDHWDQLLVERAEMSGKLVLSDFTVNAINSFKKK